MTVGQVVTDRKLDDNFSEVWTLENQQVLTLKPAASGAFFTAHLFDFGTLSALTLRLASDQPVIVIE